MNNIQLAHSVFQFSKRLLLNYNFVIHTQTVSCFVTTCTYQNSNVYSTFALHVSGVEYTELPTRTLNNLYRLLTFRYGTRFELNLGTAKLRRTLISNRTIQREGREGLERSI